MADHLQFSPSSSSYIKYNLHFQQFIGIIFHDLSLLCSLIKSNLIYFCYCIFFTPYLIKLMSFVSPTLIAVISLSILLTTTSTIFPKLPQFELLIVQMVIHELKSNLNNDNEDENDHNFKDLEIYKMIFDSTLLITASNEHDENVKGLENSYIDKFVVEQVSEAVEEPELLSSGFKNDFSNVCIQNQLVQKKISHTDIDGLGVEKILEGSIHVESRNDVKISDLKSMEEFLEEFDGFEDCVQEIEMNSDSDKVSEELSKAKQMILLEKVCKGSKEEKVGVNLSDHGKVSGTLGRSMSWRSNSSSILSSHGSVKEEKEWRRTLACKLFEERHNSVGGEEGMDSLWEDHENSNSKRYNSGIEKYNDNKDEDEDDGDEDEDEDVEMSNGHLCCLQALKLSSGKMNLGMRKPNLVKISKALKGFGWLHHVKNKNGKKS